MTASDPPQRQPAALECAEPADRFDGVGRARGREATPLAEPRTQPALVSAQANDEEMVDHGS